MTEVKEYLQNHALEQDSLDPNVAEAGVVDVAAEDQAHLQRINEHLQNEANSEIQAGGETVSATQTEPTASSVSQVSETQPQTPTAIQPLVKKTRSNSFFKNVWYVFEPVWDLLRGSLATIKNFKIGNFNYHDNVPNIVRQHAEEEAELQVVSETMRHPSNIVEFPQQENIQQPAPVDITQYRENKQPQEVSHAA